MGTDGQAEIHEKNHGRSAIVIAGRHKKDQFVPLSGTMTGNVKRLRGFVALELLLIATVVSVVAENPKPHSPCKVSLITFDGWNAEELSNPWLELVIVPQLFLSASGARVKTVDLTTVVPERPAQVVQLIERPQVAESVSVHLIDDHGRDRGSVGQARFVAAVGNSK